MVIWNAPNLLLLDEPTNHLDLEMRHALTLALQGFEGAVVTVSHDRHLLNKTVDRYWLVADGGVAPFKGGLDDYRQLISKGFGRPEETKPKPSIGNNSAASKKRQRQLQAERRARLKPLTDRVREATRALERIERKLSEVDQALSDPGLYQADRKGELQDLLRRQGELKARQRELEAEWIEAEEALSAER